LIFFLSGERSKKTNSTVIDGLTQNHQQSKVANYHTANRLLQKTSHSSAFRVISVAPKQQVPSYWRLLRPIQSSSIAGMSLQKK
jgi:hypothetical protein